MNQTYSEHLFLERQNQRRSMRQWLACFLTKTAPSFERCREAMAEQNMKLSRTDYEDVCQRLGLSADKTETPD